MLELRTYRLTAVLTTRLIEFTFLTLMPRPRVAEVTLQVMACFPQLLSRCNVARRSTFLGPEAREVTNMLCLPLSVLATRLPNECVLQHGSSATVLVSNGVLGPKQVLVTVETAADRLLCR